MHIENVYQSILIRLSTVPESYLQEVDAFLKKLAIEIHEREQNRLKILNLAGAWSDMPEQDFEDYMGEIRNTQTEMFNRNVEL